MDFVGRFERLQADFDHVRDRLGLPRIALPHVNRSRGGHRRFATAFRPGLTETETACSYRDYDDRACVDFAARLSGWDVGLLGYVCA